MLLIFIWFASICHQQYEEYDGITVEEINCWTNLPFKSNGKCSIEMENGNMQINGENEWNKIHIHIDSTKAKNMIFCIIYFATVWSI